MSAATLRTSALIVYYSVCVAAASVVICGAMYLPGWIDVDQFLWGVRFGLAVVGGGVAGGLVFVVFGVVSFLGSGRHALSAEDGACPVEHPAADVSLALPGTSHPREAVRR
ncbi:hypothetical protein [Nocardia spumae]|uniref:hypothetical protein n=1 Tax=Nocardia spumae TaxID=2887190 RepID=UPI001D138AA9|nr:hypothetical protein [Nocardia spumae]